MKLTQGKQMQEIRTLPAAEQRVESGPIRFGDDWPGVFIRGDDAAMYALHLYHFIRSRKHDAITLGIVQGLLDALRQSDMLLRWTHGNEDKVTAEDT